MPPKANKEIAMQFGMSVPKNAVVIEPLDTGVHWLSYKAGEKARIREFIRQRHATKKFHLDGQHDQEDHGNWADGERNPERAALFDAEREIRANRKFETAVAIKDGKHVLWKAGDKSSVSFIKTEVEKLRDATFTHNHPNSMAFSKDDLHFAIQADLAEMRAVSLIANDDNFADVPIAYSITRPRDGWPSWHAAEPKLDEAHAKVRKIFERRVDSGALSIAEAESSHWAAVAALYAKAIGAKFRVIRVKKGR